ncbi:hypothetical protein C2845_PM01G14450 [Panicum miliaceum]|uniref:Uncharacterized protein n=1 Tax=Panicum miliaceum TaxID=4540 RepID=A0A3L6TRI5_PANMI|nr:hypothetical protein C2845_PM01G14450 [Panicum miliaceum]
MHPSEIPEGIDENNACRVVIDVCSFSTIEDGRSVYRKGRPLEWWVDSEYSIIDMEKDVGKHFSWAIFQEANFWFQDQNGQTSRLATDQQLLALLRASKVLKFIMIIDKCDHGDISMNVTQMEDQSQVINHDVQVEGDEQQLLVSNAEELLQVSSRGVIAEYQGKEWADEPELGVTAAGPNRMEEEEEEDHYMERGFDPEGDDPIGADEEWRYFKKQQKVQEGGSNEKVQQEKNKVEKKGKGSPSRRCRSWRRTCSTSWLRRGRHIITLYAAFEDVVSVHLVLDLCVDLDLFAALFMHSLHPEPEVARRKEDKEIRGERDCNVATAASSSPATLLNTKASM